MLGRNGIVVVFIACAIGAAAGWFAERAWGGAAGRGLPALPDEQCDDGRARSLSATNGRASRLATADAAAEKPNVTEAELAALRDKAASLDKELKDLLDSKGRKAKAGAQEKGGGASKKDKPEVSEDEALERMKRWKNARRTGS